MNAHQIEKLDYYVREAFMGHVDGIHPDTLLGIQA